MLLRWTTLWFLFSTLHLLSGCTVSERPEYYSAETASKPYQDVLSELEIAITERNFRITGHNKIGSVIREREKIDFPDYDTIQFCNLTQARVMLEMSPSSVAWMPCNIAVRSESGKIIVTARLLPTHSKDVRLNNFVKTINTQLKEIIDFAVED